MDVQAERLCRPSHRQSSRLVLLLSDKNRAIRIAAAEFTVQTKNQLSVAHPVHNMLTVPHAGEHVPVQRGKASDESNDQTPGVVSSSIQ